MTAQPDLPSNIGPVREAHRFDEAALDRFCRAAIDGYQGNLQVQQFDGGQSNPTFFLQADIGGRTRRYVLRKKPPGKLLKSAHQVDREYRVMKALAETDVPVPEMIAYCGDPEVIGTEFYLMAYLPGRVFRDPTLPDIAPEERAKIYDAMNAALAALHKVDYEAVGLGDFGRPGNYFERQINRWITQYRASQTDEIAAMESLIEWMPNHIPADDSTSIAHGDFRLENTMFAPDAPRMIAVLDWELSTIGHPLADLGYNCMLYHMESPSQGGLTKVDFKSSGIPDERSYVEAYCRRTGRATIENWSFYVAFSVFRLAAISQGVYKRGLDGNASSARATSLGNMCGFLAQTAERILEEDIRI